MRGYSLLVANPNAVDADMNRHLLVTVRNDDAGADLVKDTFAVGTWHVQSDDLKRNANNPTVPMNLHTIIDVFSAYPDTLCVTRACERCSNPNAYASIAGSTVIRDSSTARRRLQGEDEGLVVSRHFVPEARTNRLLRTEQGGLLNGGWGSRRPMMIRCYLR